MAQFVSSELFKQRHAHNHAILCTYIQFFYLKQVTVGSYGYQWDVGEDFDGSSVPHLKLRIEKRTYSDIDPTTKTYDVSSEKVTGEYYYRQ